MLLMQVLCRHCAATTLGCPAISLLGSPSDRAIGDDISDRGLRAGCKSRARQTFARAPIRGLRIAVCAWAKVEMLHVELRASSGKEMEAVDAEGNRETRTWQARWSEAGTSKGGLAFSLAHPLPSFTPSFFLHYCLVAPSAI